MPRYSTNLRFDDKADYDEIIEAVQYERRHRLGVCEDTLNGFLLRAALDHLRDVRIARARREKELEKQR